MFENIEKIIRHSGVLYVDEARYGRDDIMVCIDILSTENQGETFYTGTEIQNTIDKACSPGDIDAMNAIFKLESFAKIHPEFLYASGETLAEALNNLEKRASLWNQISSNKYILSDKQSNILLEFVAFEDYY